MESVGQSAELHDGNYSEEKYLREDEFLNPLLQPHANRHQTKRHQTSIPRAEVLKLTGALIFSDGSTEISNIV